MLITIEFIVGEVVRNSIIQDSSMKVVREMLIQKLKVEGKWKAQFKHLKKAQLLRKVLKLVIEMSLKNCD